MIPVGDNMGLFYVFSLQPAAEKAAFEKGNDDKEGVCKQNENERRDQYPCILLPGTGALPDKRAHADKIKQNAQVKVQQDRRTFPETDPRVLREKVPGVHRTQYNVH